MIDNIRPETIVRAVFAVATVIFGAVGLVAAEPRLLVAAGIFGILWTLWDVIWERWIAPGAAWGFRSLTGDLGESPPDLRPTLDDTIRLLEAHLAGRASRRVQIQAAIRLEEIYRTVRKDPARARAVIARARERFPDAPELQALDRDSGSPDPGSGSPGP